MTAGQPGQLVIVTKEIVMDERNKPSRAQCLMAGVENEVSANYPKFAGTNDYAYGTVAALFAMLTDPNAAPATIAYAKEKGEEWVASGYRILALAEWNAMSDSERTAATACSDEVMRYLGGSASGDNRECSA